MKFQHIFQLRFDFVRKVFILFFTLFLISTVFLFIIFSTFEAKFISIMFMFIIMFTLRIKKKLPK